MTLLLNELTCVQALPGQSCWISMGRFSESRSALTTQAITAIRLQDISQSAALLVLRPRRLASPVLVVVGNTMS